MRRYKYPTINTDTYRMNERIEEKGEKGMIDQKKDEE